MQRRTLMAALAGGAVGLALAGGAWGGAVPTAAPAPGQQLYSGAALAFGTTMAISVWHHDRRQAERAIAAAFDAAREVDRLMSIYRADSQVFQLNRDGALARPDRRLLQVLEQARELSTLTAGAFDVTVQPLWQTFSAAAADGNLPSERRRQQAQARVGWRQLVFDTERVAFLRPGMALTLNGLAQGYAADLALAALRAHGIEHALLDTGEFIARGHKPDRQPWRVGIAHPRRTGVLAATVALDGRSMATSGDYETAFSADFAHHHIFDPARGDSPPELASVTVLAPSGLLADGWSTAFMVLGAQRAHALAARLPAIDLMTIDKHGAIRTSPGFPAA